MGVGVVSELWRYPVKSLGGERLDEVPTDRRGVVGDRWFAVVGADGKLGSGKTTRRFRRMPGLLQLGATTGSHGAVSVRMPDGSVVAVGDPAADVAVSAVVDEPVTLQAEAAVSHHDEAAVHVLTTASLRWLAARRPDDVVDVRRFRPNVVIDAAGDGLVEDEWVGRCLHLGDAVLRVTNRATRCVMVAMAQGDLGFAPKLVSTIQRENDFCLGVFASVEVPGRIPVGATVRLQ